MQLKQSQSFTYTTVLLGLATLADASPLQKAHPRTTAFDAGSATQADFAANALEVAQSRVANSSTCSPENISVRKLWENLTSDERIAYTDALNCLMEKPAKTPSDVAAGAKTRYDDFIVTHINQTLSIHSTVSSLINLSSLGEKKRADRSPRPTSSAGTAGSSGRWSRPCGANATTRAPSHTGTGQRPQRRDSPTPKCLTAPRHRFLETAWL